VVAGLEKRNLFSPEEKIMLSYYECGKAVVGWFTEGADPVVKLSILPFSKASKGYSHSIRDEHGLYTQNEILGKACCLYAGRAS
jgi:ATP-dependent Zn protease